MDKKKTKINKFEEKINDLENKWKRALADYENLQKRVEKERIDFVKFSNAQLLDKLLPILDELERCQTHLKNKGLELVIQKFRAILESEGVREIEAKGKKFDPITMDAIELVEGEKDIVTEVVMKGYQLNEKVLRPAKVKVGAGRKKK